MLTWSPGWAVERCPETTDVMPATDECCTHTVAAVLWAATAVAACRTVSVYWDDAASASRIGFMLGIIVSLVAFLAVLQVVVPLHRAPSHRCQLWPLCLRVGLYVSLIDLLVAVIITARSEPMAVLAVVLSLLAYMYDVWHLGMMWRALRARRVNVRQCAPVPTFNRPITVAVAVQQSTEAGVETQESSSSREPDADGAVSPV
jgi:hypothetical protein